jgi:hypothetical protein
MVCPNCGYNNQVNNRFCVRCGVDISVPPPPDTPSFESGSSETGRPEPRAPAPGAPPPPPSAPAPAAPNPWGAPQPPSPYAAPGSPPPPPQYPAPQYPPPQYPPPTYAPPPAGPYGNPTTASAPPNPFAPPGAYPPPPGAGPYAPYPSYPQSGYPAPSTNGLAIAALVLSIVGWVPCGVGSVVAVILGFVARNQIRQSQGRQGGDGLALAGIILGFVGIALVVFVLVLGVASGSNSSTG